MKASFHSPEKLILFTKIYFKIKGPSNKLPINFKALQRPPICQTLKAFPFGHAEDRNYQFEQCSDERIDLSIVGPLEH